jgi:hypothetical protein
MVCCAVSSLVTRLMVTCAKLFILYAAAGDACSLVFGGAFDDLQIWFCGFVFISTFEVSDQPMVCLASRKT